MDIISKEKIERYIKDNSLTINKSHDKLLTLILNDSKTRTKLMNYLRGFKHYQNIFSYLYLRYDDSLSLQETMHRIINNIDEIPKCKTCGKPVKYNIACDRYNEICSRKCTNNYDKCKKTCIDRYGVDNPYKIDIAKEHYKKTCIDRYGVDNPNKAEQVKEKIRHTCMEKYGVENYTQTKEYLEKTKKTNLKKFGCEFASQSKVFRDKVKATCMEKYGTENWVQCKEGRERLSYLLSSDEIKNKKINNSLLKFGVEHPWQSEEIKNKKIKTNIKKYGAPYWQQSDIGKETLSYILSQDEVRQKMYDTKKRNNSFNKSQPEIECGKLLREKFSDVIPQHKDKLYPFNCDFYVPSMKLYIEFQGTWTHGGHPYDETNIDDINKVNLWKSKIKSPNSWYIGSIKNWTISDVKKRNIAKQNNLNYIEFWNINEVKEWLKSQ